MVDLSGPPGSSGMALIERVKAIILKPKDEWPRIAAEPTTQAQILKSHVLPLAAIGPVASLLGGQIFGYGGFGFSFRPGIVSALVTALLGFALTILGVFVLAYIADRLASRFGGQPDKVRAFKLVAYGATAAWVAGIFGLIPALAVFGLLGLYTVYLFYTGSAPLMQVPDDKRIAYTAVTFLAAAVLYWIVSVVVVTLIGLVGLGAGAMAGYHDLSRNDEVSINIPGVGKIDTGKVQEAAEQARKIKNGELKPVPTDTLKAMLPDTIGEFSRTGISTTAMGNVGSGVEGDYKGPEDGKGSQYTYQLKVQDMLALSGLAGIGSAMGIEQSHEDQNGYDRTGTVDGQWREEKWSKSDSDGTYAVLVGNRFRVEASGRVPSVDVLKNAVSRIDQGELNNLANQ